MFTLLAFVGIFLVGDSLLLVFASTFFLGGGDLRIIILPKNESSLSDLDNHRWWGHSNPTNWVKKLNIMHSQAVWTQKLCDFP